MNDKILYQAHRGVSTDYPENTMSAFEGAISQGYDIIDLGADIIETTGKIKPRK